MKISLNNVSFAYGNNSIFSNLSMEAEDSSRPLVILGHSGSGKTTLLKLLGGLLKADKGEVITAPKTAFMFQEPRLLPWLSVLDNVRIPLEKEFGKDESFARARKYLSLVSLDHKTEALPAQISGGEAQRVSMARAFAWQAQALFIDEPFQSLDVSLRKNLMNLTLSLLEKEKRLAVMVTHDPREAVYMGSRVIVLGKPGQGIVFDKTGAEEEEIEKRLL